MKKGGKKEEKKVPLYNMNVDGGMAYMASYANLNGVYHTGGSGGTGHLFDWSSWKGYHYSLKESEMKIRPAT